MAMVVALLSAPARADVGLKRVATGLDDPMYVTAPPGDTDRLFIAEKGGIVKILNLNTGTINATPFLTIGDTDEGGDGGLQSIAFHPDYASNGQFYVHVTVDNEDLPIDGGTSPFSSHIRSNGQMSCMGTESGGFVLEAVDELNAGDDLGDER